MSRKNLKLENVNSLSAKEQSTLKGGRILGSTRKKVVTKIVANDGSVTYSCGSCVGGCNSPCSGLDVLATGN